MATTAVNVYIFPSCVDVTEIDNYDESVYGKTYSNLDEIRVNQVTGGYSILYNDQVFSKLETSVFGDALVKLFTDNLPETTVELEIFYFYMGRHFSTECGIAVLQLDDYLVECDNPAIEYSTSESVAHLMASYDDEDEEFYFTDGDRNQYERDDEFNILDPFDFGNVSPPKKIKKKSYGHSRILMSSKNAKRNIKRHGVIVSSNKDAMKKDKKILQNFLKDFIPGKSEWIKEYRKEILVRWLDMYVISKKIAKEMAKEHKSRSTKKRNKLRITKETAMNFTKKLFSYDPFLDPNR